MHKITLPENYLRIGFQRSKKNLDYEKLCYVYFNKFEINRALIIIKQNIVQVERI